MGSRCARPIDFEAIDGRPVELVLMLGYPAEKIRPGGHESMCNPIFQAKLLNQAQNLEENLVTVVQGTALKN